MYNIVEDKRDILLEVYNHQISSQDAQDLYELLFEKFHEGKLLMHAEEYLCFSVCERTAIVLYGIPFDAIAKWRYEGWPTECALCSKRLSVGKEPWGACTKFRIEGKEHFNILFHWDCYRYMARDDDNGPL
jgi:hypothetical protein